MKKRARPATSASRTPVARHDNPFRIGGTVAGPFFTDREAEIARCAATLQEPGAKLLVYGPRRTGKSSSLQRSVDQVNAAGGHAFIADLSTATTMVDISNRILAGAIRAVGRRWTTLLTDLVTHLQASLALEPDPTTGLMLPSFRVSVRDGALEEQQASLVSALDSLNALAGARGVVLGVVLDEFQEITRFGGSQAEWHLRGAMQRHDHLGYVVAGSKPALIRAMIGRGRAFYELFEPLRFGPIESLHFAAWIDDRMRAVGLEPHAAGAQCIQLAGARTRDVVRLARKCVDRADRARDIDALAIEAAFREVIDEIDDSTHAWWEDLTSLQQNVLRAVAATSRGLTSKAVHERFALPVNSVPNTLKALVGNGHLLKTRHGAGYAFDNPFVRGWVIVNALPDLGIQLPVTHIASPNDEYEAP
jgi:Cdc6-like AAA superfamily ATPase